MCVYVYACVCLCVCMCVRVDMCNLQNKNPKTSTLTQRNPQTKSTDCENCCSLNKEQPVHCDSAIWFSIINMCFFICLHCNPSDVNRLQLS